jgi:hypothetical protein
MAQKEGFDNIRLEPVKNFTKWVRGKEELYLHSPRPFPQKLDLIGLGMSISGYLSHNADTSRLTQLFSAVLMNLKAKRIK